LRMVRRDAGSIVTWRRAQIVLLAAQRTPGPIARVVFRDQDGVREVLGNFNRIGSRRGIRGIAVVGRRRSRSPNARRLPGSRSPTGPISTSRLRPGVSRNPPTTWSRRGW